MVSTSLLRGLRRDPSPGPSGVPEASGGGAASRESREPGPALAREVLEKALQGARGIYPQLILAGLEDQAAHHENVVLDSSVARYHAVGRVLEERFHNSHFNNYAPDNFIMETLSVARGVKFILQALYYSVRYGVEAQPWPMNVAASELAMLYCVTCLSRAAGDNRQGTENLSRLSTTELVERYEELAWIGFRVGRITNNYVGSYVEPRGKKGVSSEELTQHLVRNLVDMATFGITESSREKAMGDLCEVAKACPKLAPAIVEDLLSIAENPLACELLPEFADSIERFPRRGVRIREDAAIAIARLIPEDPQLARAVLAPNIADDLEKKLHALHQKIVADSSPHLPSVYWLSLYRQALKRCGFEIPGDLRELTDLRDNILVGETRVVLSTLANSSAVALLKELRPEYGSVIGNDESFDLALKILKRIDNESIFKNKFGADWSSPDSQTRDGFLTELLAVIQYCRFPDQRRFFLTSDGQSWLDSKDLKVMGSPECEIALLAVAAVVMECAKAQQEALPMAAVLIEELALTAQIGNQKEDRILALGLLEFIGKHFNRSHGQDIAEKIAQIRKNPGRFDNAPYSPRSRFEPEDDSEPADELSPNIDAIAVTAEKFANKLAAYFYETRQ